jgi:7-carboxy-7-deazaguanine synthase
MQYLPVMEHFYTLQGEGYYQGQAAYFVRLGGCDVGCVWCDVKDSWDASKHPQCSIEQIVKEVANSNTNIAVITGGEPAMHNLDKLTSALQQANIRTHIETSGAHPITGQWHWICLSPKKFKTPLVQNLLLAHELKIIVYNKSDFEWAEQYATQVHEQCKLYLQPEWSKVNEMAPLIVEYIKAKPQWQLSLQSHKYINIP